MVLNDWIDRFAVWQGFHPDLQTLLIYGAGIAAYAALVFAVYQNISRRDPLHSHDRKGWWGRVLHTAETILTFPALSFLYLVVMSLALFLMAKPERATSDILLLSMAAVLGVRVTAHISESLANDVSKLLPLSLLAVVVVDFGYLTVSHAIVRLGEAVTLLPVLAQYFALFIVVEGVLRLARAFFPSLGKLASRVEHKRRLSKRAMLRDIDAEHESFRRKSRQHHDHGPRDRGKEFLALDENAGGKPGSRQGVGPALDVRHGREAASAAGAGRHASGAAIRHEIKRAHAAAASHAHKPVPKAGPGGSGGKLGTW